MRVPLQWLKQYVNVELDAESLAEVLTNSGSAVEALEFPTRGARGVVVGRIGKTRPHPRADRLTLCEVDWGEGVKEIACGAPNARQGLTVAVAVPGSVLADGRTIGEAEIKGVVSQGMLLSGEELGLNDDSSGILELEEGLPPGTNLVDLFGLDEAVLDLEITPNRPDCLCMLGVAREVAALTGESLRLPEIRLEETARLADEGFSVEVLEPELCSRYVARVIDDVAVRPSPLWMQLRLRLAGVRAISNVVDVTNYVMLELGQPLHAFDAEKVSGGRVIVRRARDGEGLVTLDGVSRRLQPHSLLICDSRGAIALAGVMGGEDTEVSADTRTVLLESAAFSPASVARTAREQELPSEASYRFERRVDPAGSPRAADRAAFLMQEHAGGKVRGGALDVLAAPIVAVELDLRLKRAESLLGAELEEAWVAGALRGLGLEVKEESGGEGIMRLAVPTFRPDLEREIDLVEEIARVYGYSRFEATLPAGRSRRGGLSPGQRDERLLRELLVGIGLQEVITYSFVSPEENALFATAGAGRALTLANPLSEEAGEMRSSLFPGLLRALLHNFNRHQSDAAVFETGRVFHPLPGEKLPREDRMLGVAVMGDWAPRRWDAPPAPADLFTVKGIWESLLACFSPLGAAFEAGEAPYLHPSLAASLTAAGQRVGEAGVLHPLLLKKMGLPEGVAVLQLDLGAFFALPRAERVYREIPRFPAIHMDLSLAVKEEVGVGDLEKVIRESGGGLLKEVVLFDLYRGDQIPPGEKSLAFKLSFYDAERTLKDEEAKRCFAEIAEALRKETGAVVRE